MARSRALPCLLALVIALPCVAQADTVEVTMHSSGFMTANPLVLVALRMDTTVTDQLPFDLTISASFDPNDPVPGPYGPTFSDQAAPVEMSFQLGNMSYHYAGTANADVFLTGIAGGMANYSLEFSFGATTDRKLLAAASVAAPVGSFGANVLSPLSLGMGPGVTGYTFLGSYPSNPDAPGYWSMSGNSDRFALQVASPVPEPAPVGMLAAGMLILAGRGWRTRRMFSPAR